MKKDSFFVKKRKIKIIGYISGESLHPMAGIALIATVGHGMTNKIGVAAKLFTALAENKVNVRIIDQGSSQINIITGVDEADTEKAIKAIYAAFVK